MRKGKYIDIYVIMACMSHKKPNFNLQQVNQLIETACLDCDETNNENSVNESYLVSAESIAG